MSSRMLELSSLSMFYTVQDPSCEWLHPTMKVWSSHFNYKIKTPHTHPHLCNHTPRCASQVVTLTVILSLFPIQISHSWIYFSVLSNCLSRPGRKNTSHEAGELAPWSEALVTWADGRSSALVIHVWQLTKTFYPSSRTPAFSADSHSYPHMHTHTHEIIKNYKLPTYMDTQGYLFLNPQVLWPRWVLLCTQASICLVGFAYTLDCVERPIPTSYKILKVLGELYSFYGSWWHLWLSSKDFHIGRYWGRHNSLSSPETTLRIAAVEWKRQNPQIPPERKRAIRESFCRVLGNRQRESESALDSSGQEAESYPPLYT